MKKSIMLIFVAMLLTVSLVSATKCQDCQRPPACPAGSHEAGNSPEAFANAVVDSFKTSHASDALGDDDNKYAEIKDDYGYLILDMGEGEEIVNTIGVDMRVYGDDSGEWVYVYVSNSPTGPWTFADFLWSDGDKDAQIGYTGLSSARYVKLYNPSKKKHVEIDAVRAKCIPDTPENEVPEFGTLAALAALAGAGLVIYKRRK